MGRHLRARRHARPILDRINATTDARLARTRLAQPVVQKRLVNIGMPPAGSGRADAAAFITTRREVAGRPMRQGGIVLD
jgi:hypothetical protein